MSINEKKWQDVLLLDEKHSEEKSTYSNSYKIFFSKMDLIFIRTCDEKLESKWWLTEKNNPHCLCIFSWQWYCGISCSSIGCQARIFWLCWWHRTFAWKRKFLLKNCIFVIIKIGSRKKMRTNLRTNTRTFYVYDQFVSNIRFQISDLQTPLNVVRLIEDKHKHTILYRYRIFVWFIISNGEKNERKIDVVGSLKCLCEWF